MWSLLFFLITVGLAVIGVIGIQRALHLRRVRNKINQRLVAMVDETDESKLFSKTDLLKSANQGAANNFIWAHLQKQFKQSGLKWKASRLILTTMTVWLSGYIIYASFLTDAMSNLLLALVSALIGMYWYVSRQRSLRIRAFILALPDALGVVVRSLRAGHPLNEGIRMVAEEMPEPVGSEFRAMLEQMAVGAEAETAMINMYHNVGSEEVKLMAVTLSIQSGTGGNLAEVFEKLATTIRQRTMLAVKVKSISAEGRASAAIMSVFPLILYGIISLASPGYFDPVWDSDYALHMVSICLAAIALGTFILMRMVDFDR